MKESRVLQWAKSGLIPLQPPLEAEAGAEGDAGRAAAGRGAVCYLPLNMSLDLNQQGPCDAVLHKITDFLCTRGRAPDGPAVEGDAHGPLHTNLFAEGVEGDRRRAALGIDLSPTAQRLCAWVTAHPDMVLVDSWEKLGAFPRARGSALGAPCSPRAGPGTRSMGHGTWL